MELMDKCLLVGPWMISGKAIFLKKWIPDSHLSKEEHKLFPIWVRLSNVPIEYWTSTGLSWVASAIGKPLQLDPKTACMKNVASAKICVEVGVDDSFPTHIVLQSCSDFDSQIVVNVEYNWKPIHCSYCHLLSHDESSCKSKKIFRPTGKIISNPFTSYSPAAGRDKRDLSKQPASLYGQSTGIPSCSANPFALLPGDDGSSGPDVVDHSELELQSLHTNEDDLITNMDVDTLGTWESSAENVGPSLQLDQVSSKGNCEEINVVQTNLDDGGLAIELESLPVNSHQNIGNLSGECAALRSVVPFLKDAVEGSNPENITCGLGVDGPHSYCNYIASFAKILKCGINTNIPYCEASLLIQPISDMDRSEALGRSYCVEEVAGSSLSSYTPCTIEIIPVAEHLGPSA